MTRNTGRVVRFDAVRGYGFIAPDAGGEDVFLHVNDLEIDKAAVKSGTRVSFEIEDGPRGKFATAVKRSIDMSDQSTPHGTAPNSSDEYYDILTTDEFKHMICDILLNVRPSINGEQIQNVRAAFETLARKYGWIE